MGAQRLALALQGAQLHRHAPAPVFDAFCRSRLDGDGAAVFGTLPPGLDLDAIAEAHAPGVGFVISGNRFIFIDKQGLRIVESGRRH